MATGSMAPYLISKSYPLFSMALDMLVDQAQVSKAIFLHREAGGKAASAFQKVAPRSSNSSGRDCIILLKVWIPHLAVGDLTTRRPKALLALGEQYNSLASSMRNIPCQRVACR